MICVFTLRDVILSYDSIATVGKIPVWWRANFQSGTRVLKKAPQPLIVNSAFVALYVGIILPIGPIPISLFLFELEAED